MANVENYRSKATNAGKYDLANKTKNPQKKNSVSRDDKIRIQVRKWTSFYRCNIHRFIEDYFGIKLFFYQMVMLYFMNICPYVMTVGSRGISKSFMIAIYACARAVLYPNSKIIVASGTKGQGKLIITEKIEKELMQYPNLAREIKMVRASANEAKVVFVNGSTIEAVTSTENSRG